MEIHHHAHTARKKWTHYFWEFFMLFLAVTLGFLVENKREVVIEGHRAKAYARMLKEDLIKDTSELQQLISQKDSISRNYQHFSNIIEKNHKDITIDDIDFMLVGKMDIMNVFVPNDVTYTQLKNSGSLRYFHNMELVGKLGAYDAELRRFQSDWNNTKDLFGGIRSPYLLQFMIHAERFLTGNKKGVKDRSALNAGYNFESFDEASQILNFFLWFQEGVRDHGYKNLKVIATEIIVLLNKEYHLKS